MPLKMSIKSRLLAGYGFVVLTVLTATILTLLTLRENRLINERIANVHVPSVSYLNELRNLVLNSNMLIKSWVFIDTKSNTPDKQRLREIHSEGFDRVTDRLRILAQDWPADDRASLERIIQNTRDTLFRQHQYVMDLLPDFDSYNRPAAVFEATSMVEENNDEIMMTSRTILHDLDHLIASQEKRVLTAKAEVKESFDRFRWMIMALGAFIVLGSLFIAQWTTRSIVNPLRLLTSATRELADDNLDVKVLLDSQDELQVLAEAFNQMAGSLKENREFLTSANESLEKEKLKLEEVNQTLQKSQEMLREVTATREQIFTIVAHDLKNAYTSLLTITGVFKTSYAELPESERHEFICKIHHSAESLLFLTENLLNWAAVKSSTISFRPEKIDLKEQISLVFSTLAFEAEKKNIHLQCSIRDSMFAYADPEMIRTILRNLIQNAIKFSPKNSEILVFGDHKNKCFEVTIKDFGTGMTHDEVLDIFKPIQKRKSKERNPLRGSGLGLVVCREFLEKNQGFLAVTSLPGEGSAFTFVLPSMEEG